MEKARRAGLLAKRETLQKKHKVEVQEAELRRLREELELQAEIDECEANEKVLGQYESMVTQSDIGERKAQEVKNEEKQCHAKVTGKL